MPNMPICLTPPPPLPQVVGSMDASATRFAARVSMQSGRQEIVADLKGVRRGDCGEPGALGLGVAALGGKGGAVRCTCHLQF